MLSGRASSSDLSSSSSESMDGMSGAPKCCCPSSSICRYIWDDSDNKFPPIRTLFLFGSFLFYVLDVGLDAWVAYEHYFAYQTGSDPYSVHYFRATVFFIVFPLVIINFLSWALYTWSFSLSVSDRFRRKYTDDNAENLVYVEYGKDGSPERGKNVVVQDIKVFKHRKYVRRDDSTAAPPRSPTRQPNNGQPSGAKASSMSRTFEWVPGSPQQEEMTPNPSSQVWLIDSNNITDGRPPRPLSPGVIGGGARCGMEGSPPCIESTDVHVEFYPLDFFDPCEYLLVSLLHLCMLGYVFRVLRLLYRRKQDKYSFDRYRDLSFLRLMEAFLESAPQVVLQLYIELVKPEARFIYMIVTPISITVSMISLALAVGDYISACKDLYYYDPPPSHFRKERLSWFAYILILLWHLAMIAVRGVAFALFASVYGAAIFIFMGLHYLIMLYWVYLQHAKVFVKSSSDYFYRRKYSWIDPRTHILANYGVEFLVALFNTFFHFKIKGGSSLYTIVVFYTLTFWENAILVLLWFFGRDLRLEIWYEYPSLALVFGGFFVGMLFMALYYSCFKVDTQKTLAVDPDLEHPTGTLTCSLNRFYQLDAKGNFARAVAATLRRKPKPLAANSELTSNNRVEAALEMRMTRDLSQEELVG